VITPEMRAEMRRLVLAERWKVETVARRFHVHHSVVRRALRNDPPISMLETRPSGLDKFKSYIVERLAEYPELTSVRLFADLRERGFKLGIAQLRRYVASVRAPRSRKVYLRVEPDPGEQAQVDWGSFGFMRIGTCQRPLYAFSMVPSRQHQSVQSPLPRIRWASPVRANGGAGSISGGEGTRRGIDKISSIIVLLRTIVLVTSGYSRAGRILERAHGQFAHAREHTRATV
jgi:hypothetical protein